MKIWNKKMIYIYISLLTYLSFATFYGYKNFPTTMSLIINPLFYLLLFIASLFLSDEEHTQRIKAKTNKHQTIFITVTSYLMIEILLGLVLGYTKSIYSHTFIDTIKNIWIYISPITGIELTRNILVRNSNDSKLCFFLTVFIFTLTDLNLHIIILKSYTSKELLKLLFSTIIPAITNNLVLTYITKNSGYMANLIYKVPQSLTMLILPILPNIDWYLKSLSQILLATIVYILIRNIENKTERQRNRITRKKIWILPPLLPILILALFTTGVFKYKPTAIMSNSMHPIYHRGDVIIIEKTSETMLKDLKKYDIIEYILDDTIVAHRIIHIEKHNNGNDLYITKGDNNTIADKEKVTKEQIIGKVKFKIPKIGYPTVWLNDFLNKKEAPVQ